MSVCNIVLDFSDEPLCDAKRTVCVSHTTLIIGVAQVAFRSRVMLQNLVTSFKLDIEHHEKYYI